MSDNNRAGGEKAVRLAAPEMAAGGEAMFSPLTADENGVLHAHLHSGCVKQDVVYPGMDEMWKETCATLRDLSRAWDIARQAEREAFL